MDAIDARLYSQERYVISNGYLRSLTRALRSAWSAAVAATIFGLALVLLQVGFIALLVGFAMYTRSFGLAF